MAEIDQNSRNIGLAFAPGFSPEILPLLVNPLTGKLRIEVIPISPIPALVSLPSNIPIDENNRNISAGITDDTNETITPLTVDMIGNVPFLRIQL